MLNRTKLIFKTYIGLDRTIMWSTINKLFGMIKGIVLIFFLTRYLSPQEQGLWYTFINLGALTVFAELGFTNIITQFVSHEFAHLNIIDETIHGDERHINRLFGLVRFSLKLYRVLIPLGIFIMLIVGFFYFNKKFDSILLAWVLFSLSGGIDLLVKLLANIYQGLDKIKEMQVNAVIGSGSTVLFICIFLAFHFNIWALVIGSILGYFVSLMLLYRVAPFFWNQVISLKLTERFNFFPELIPLQWRYAISFASGFFIMYLAVPSTYKYVGKIEAGQLGITLSIIGAISGISYGWVFSKVPKLNILVSLRKRIELDFLFRRAFLQGVVVHVAISLFVLVALFVFQLFNMFNNRFLSLNLSIWLIIAQLAQAVINFIAVYLRAHKEEPFVWLSVINGLLMILNIFFVLPKFGLSYFIYSTNIMLWFIVLPLAVYIFVKKKRIYLFTIYNSNVANIN